MEGDSDSGLKMPRPARPSTGSPGEAAPWLKICPEHSVSRGGVEKRRALPCVSVGLVGTPANPIYGEKVALTAEIIEFLKLKKNNTLKMQREEGSKRRGSEDSRESFCECF